MKKLCILSIILSPLVSFAYQDMDIAYANLLAEKGTISKQEKPENYNLASKILRQEIIGITLKLKGVKLPENYKCKKYFSDVTKDDWVCRAIEIAADNGIISRNNKLARPTDNAKATEAVAMFLNAKGITYPKNVKKNVTGNFSVDQEINSLSQWEYDLIQGIPDGVSFPNFLDGGLPPIERGQLFKIIYQILEYEPGLTFVQHYNNSYDQSGGIYFGEKKINLDNIGRLEDVSNLGLGEILYRNGDNIYVSIRNDGVIKINLKTLKGERIPGHDHTLSQSGKTILFINDPNKPTSLSILELASGKISSYQIDLPDSWIVDQISLSSDANTIGLFTYDLTKFWNGGYVSKTYQVQIITINRETKTVKSTKHTLEHPEINGIHYDLNTLNNGTYKLIKEL